MGIESAYVKIFGDPKELIINAFTKPAFSLLLLVFTYMSVSQPNNFNAYVLFPFYLIGQILWWGLLAAYGFDFINGDGVKFINEKAKELLMPPMTLKKAVTSIIALPSAVFLFIGVMTAVAVNVNAIIRFIFNLILGK